MPPLPPNVTKAGILRSMSGWNNSSLSRRSNTTVGLLSTRTPHSLGNSGGGIPNPSLGIGVIREAMPRNAAGSFTPRRTRTMLARYWRFPPANLSEMGENASGPQVAMDSAGNAIAVWYQRTGTNTIIQASRFSGSSWSAVTDLSAPGQDALDPQVAMDSDGNAIAVWSRYDGTNIIIQAIQYK